MALKTAAEMHAVRVVVGRNFAGFRQQLIRDRSVLGGKVDVAPAARKMVSHDEKSAVTRPARLVRTEGIRQASFAVESFLLIGYRYHGGDLRRRQIVERKRQG